MAERTPTYSTGPSHATQGVPSAPLPVAYATGLQCQVVYEEIAQEGDISEVGVG